MDKYETIEIIGEGTYGTVFKARHKETGVYYAIKKFKESDEDQAIRKIAMREIRILKSLSHHNVVTLFEVFRRNKHLYLVFEYVENTILSELETNQNGLSQTQVKKIMYQLVSAIKYCHSHNIVHRDIKPENLLLTQNGILKLCDFGFARVLATLNGKYTDYVSTRWYRAPELLVGDNEYGKEVDVWSIGCICAELLTGLPIFPGDSDFDTLRHILSIIGGNLSDKQSNAFSTNPIYEGVELPLPKKIVTLETKFKEFPSNVVSFLKGCFVFDPKSRFTCDDLLKHDYFSTSFKASFEHELLEIFNDDTENNFSLKKSMSEHSSPEPGALPRTVRDVTPKRNIAKSINLKSDEIVPGKDQEIERNQLPPPNFLPNLRLRRDEETYPNLSHQEIKKKKSDLKIPVLNGAKHFNESRQIPSLKQIEIDRGQNVSPTYFEHEDGKMHYSVKGRHNSKSNLKVRNGDFAYIQAITPVPQLNHRQVFGKKSNIKLLKPRIGFEQNIARVKP
ncbi:CDKL2_1 [Blepharisma stoltei]|uniref:Cyclin-dependent kinase 2 homolog n=1 Tax=Blepharisma stoltei TaxID=1481888 RepID=A0AAU9INB5_9CILI|nr:unnamed protein product [Blepharisma stoltei]